MEPRESPRTGRSEGTMRDPSTPGDPNRFARFVRTPAVRRLALSRIGLAVLASVGALILCLFASSRLLSSLSSWLHAQPQYQLTLESITFDPPLPPWYRGGKAAFLKRVGIPVSDLPADSKAKSGAESDAPTSTSALDLDLKMVSKRLETYCWVKKFGGIHRSSPNRLRISLSLHLPVAFVDLRESKRRIPLDYGDLGESDRLILDENAFILPTEDFDPSKAGPLLRISRIAAPPSNPKEGMAWKRRDPETGVDVKDDIVAEAAKLAGFVKAAQEEDRGKLSNKRRFVSVFARVSGVGSTSTTGRPQPTRDDLRLCIQSKEGLWVFWGDAPGQERPGTLTATEKWSKVRDWLARHDASDMRAFFYLAFTPTDIVYVQGKRPGN
ncbi:cell division protein FtsQ/DivIB [Singulisphaera rosea]